MHIFKNFFKRLEEKQNNSRIKTISNQFNIIEHNGEVWIICNDLAVEKITKESSVSEVLDKLHTMRNTAYSFLKSE